jgi:hypothetical protein
VRSGVTRTDPLADGIQHNLVESVSSEARCLKLKLDSATYWLTLGELLSLSTLQFLSLKM